MPSEKEPVLFCTLERNKGCRVAESPVSGLPWKVCPMAGLRENLPACFVKATPNSRTMTLNYGSTAFASDPLLRIWKAVGNAPGLETGCLSSGSEPHIKRVTKVSK